jgi:hypothetical protein
MSEKQQTAVDWLFLMLNNPNRDQEFANKLLQKAKEMEKERMIEFAKNCFDYLLDNNEDCILLTTQDRIEHFFNEIYGGNK